MTGRLVPKTDGQAAFTAVWRYLRLFRQTATIPVIKVNRAKSSNQVTIGVTPFAGSEPTAKRATPDSILPYATIYVNNLLSLALPLPLSVERAGNGFFA